MKYQSFSRITKSYHGVVFHPGDIKDVDGYINDKNFVRIKEDNKTDKLASKSTSESKKQEEKKSVEKAKVTQTKEKPTDTNKKKEQVDKTETKAEKDKVTVDEVNQFEEVK